MEYSNEERIAHVIRRLGMGANPAIAGRLSSTDEAIGAALDLSSSAPDPPPLEAPGSLEAAKDQELGDQTDWWVDQMASGQRLIEERLVLFWMDHFATSRRKVRSSFLLWQQHLTIRRHATAGFGDLLHAIAPDPAMLVYLDGVSNHKENPNENFGREVMELYTMGVGNYSQSDVVEAGRAFTGWVINIPGTRFSSELAALGVPPWQSDLIDRRHDQGLKTTIGSTADHDMVSTIDLLLEQPSTALYIAAKLYRDLVGLVADQGLLQGLAADFRSDYRVMPLVEAIVTRPEFVSDQAVRTKVRTPLEKVMTIMQAYPDQQNLRGLTEFLRFSGYVPFLPPNPAGYPHGNALLGPYLMTHTLDLLWLMPQRIETITTPDALRRLGLYDPNDSTLSVIDSFADPHSKLASVLASPEFILN